MADPQLIGTLLIPREPALGAVNFPTERILIARRNLTYRKATLSPVAQLQHHHAEVIRIDRHLFIATRLQLLAGKSLNRCFGLLAQRMHRREISADFVNLQARQKLYLVHPMRTDISHRPQRAVMLPLDAPVIIGVVK